MTSTATEIGEIAATRKESGPACTTRMEGFNPGILLEVRVVPDGEEEETTIRTRRSNTPLATSPSIDAARTTLDDDDDGDDDEIRLPRMQLLEEEVALLLKSHIGTTDWDPAEERSHSLDTSKDEDMADESAIAADDAERRKISTEKDSRARPATV